MDAAVAWMRARGVRWVLLDATEDGRPLYARMGFTGVDTSYYAWGPLDALHIAPATNTHARRAAASELGRVRWLDEQAFGGDRIGLVARLLAEPGAALYLAEDSGGAIAGYLLARPAEAPRTGARVGPWVARSPATAAALLARALEADAPWRAYLPPASAQDARLALSLPGSSTAAIELLRAAGLRVEADDLIMRLDLEAPSPPPGIAPAASLATAATATEQPHAAHPEWVYAWLAPMVF
jgi:hypothetical protein